MHFLRKYGVQTTIVFPIPKIDDTDFAASGDWTPATGDTKISKDGGNFANTTNNPAAIGGTGSKCWSLVVTATELECAVAIIQIDDAAVEDQAIIIETYGHASAQHAADLDDATKLGLSDIGDIKTAADAIQVVTDKLSDTLEDAGGGNWRFTSAALANSPAGLTVDAILDAFQAKSNVGQLQGGSVNSAQLASSASSEDDFYNDSLLWVIDPNTGFSQFRKIPDYTGSTRNIPGITPNWAVTPEADWYYLVTGQ